MVLNQFLAELLSFSILFAKYLWTAVISPTHLISIILANVDFELLSDPSFFRIRSTSAIIILYPMIPCVSKKLTADLTTGLLLCFKYGTMISNSSGAS